MGKKMVKGGIQESGPALKCEKCGKMVHKLKSLNDQLLCPMCFILRPQQNGKAVSKKIRLKENGEYLIRAIKISRKQFDQLGIIADKEQKTRYALYNEAIQTFIDSHKGC